MPLYGPPTDEEREKLDHPPRSPAGQEQLTNLRLKEEYGVDPGVYKDSEMKRLYKQMKEDVEQLRQRRRDLKLQIEALEEYISEMQPLYEEVIQDEAQEELDELTDEEVYPTESNQ